MPDSSSHPDTISPDDALPPVQEPSAGFILQLFIVPGMIVLVIVIVWLSIYWLARRGDDPMHMISRLRVPSAGRWQFASQLANALANPRHEALRQNAVAARELAGILDFEVDAGRVGEEAVSLRIFLCRALGEFHVRDGMDALIRTAAVEGGEQEVSVRCAAIEAIAVRSDYWSGRDPPQPLPQDPLEETMLQLAGDDQPLVRSATAFSLGVIGGERLLDKLAVMLDDPYPDARYNAAVALARNGDVRSIEVLEEMLDVTQLDGVAIEKVEPLRGYKRATIVKNALAAAEMLAERDHDADLGALISAIRRLTGEGVDRSLYYMAQNTLKRLEQRAVGVAP